MKDIFFSFINWWKYIGSNSVEEHGRGQKIVKAIMTQILENMENIEELELITKYNFDTIDRVKLDDLDQRLAFNTQRVSTLENYSKRKLKLYLE